MGAGFVRHEPFQAYSVADPRVKELAYVVKHWAKRRWVNNASEGTLSSYGYLLCLVHYLQTRRPPVVPNLQVGNCVIDWFIDWLRNMKSSPRDPFNPSHYPQDERT